MTLLKRQKVSEYRPVDRLTYPVSGPTREDVPDDGPAVATARDTKTKTRPVVTQLDHLNLSPVTLKLQVEIYFNVDSIFYILMNVNVQNVKREYSSKNSLR